MYFSSVFSQSARPFKVWQCHLCSKQLRSAGTLDAAGLPDTSSCVFKAASQALQSAHVCCRRRADCFWTIEEDDGKRFIEITIAKGRQEVWKHVLESEDSASAKAAVTDYVFLDVAEDGTAIGRVTLGLFGGAAPKTVENFRALATGEKARWTLWMRRLPTTQT